MEMLKDNLTAIILAAGLGTRMKSARAKVLHEILGRPMLAYLIDTLKSLGVSDIVLVVGHQAEQVKEAYKAYGVRFVVQEPQLGTGHAVQVGLSAVAAATPAVLVLCGDAPLISGESLRALQGRHEATDAAVTVQTIELTDGAHYGRVLRDTQGQVAAVLQAKDSQDRPEILAIREINTGAYVFDAAFLREALAQIPPSPVTGEIYLTDLIHIAREQGRGVAALLDPDLDNLLGINSRAELAQATQTVKRTINARHMDQGVTLMDPESTYIEPGVTIGRDTVIYPNVYLQGDTVIGENCVIESTVKIVDSTLADGVHIKMGCVLTQSRLGPGADTGPFAQLRPGADLRARVHVGNFVEVKKSVLHEGVKAGHLTYLGDAEVGAGSNVGAGTITCNYDGAKKHQTTIGEKVFIGSNTALVAPVTIGPGAYIGAGSTITEDVPPGKLGLARGRQVIKERRLVPKKKDGERPGAELERAETIKQEIEVVTQGRSLENLTVEDLKKVLAKYKEMQRALGIAEEE
jgi:bifunctional UDP-N-acetylglucosamine pyrophosphorylase/glucosamine-1-phosphate N-acetyltransferase